ncbi:MAG TPA: hypothetical protein VMS12_02710 [Thermoanaerobaculia bacterium]|nr:hypothetical protein [Thermoanaerobaculia bacterium]
MNELEIIVASLDEAGEILGSPSSCGGLGFVVSIGDPEDRPPSGYRNVREKIRLAFYDSHDHVGPNEDDIDRLIEFARLIATRPGRVLAHCAAGISRSTAAAYIIYAVAYGEGREEEALERVFAQRPIASPNRRMVAIADRRLGRRGKLIEALKVRDTDGLA